MQGKRRLTSLLSPPAYAPPTLETSLLLTSDSLLEGEVKKVNAIRFLDASH